MIIDQLIDQSLSKARGRQIKEVRAGLGYTCVLLEDDACGLSYTFRSDLGTSCGIIPEAGSLNGKNSETLIPWAKEKNFLKAAIGLATVNAVLNSSISSWDDGNVIGILDVKPTEIFGMVGDFAPILSKIKTLTDNIYVFERNTAKGEGLYPESAIPMYLPECDVIVITATSIINHTIDSILPYCKNAREICIVGASTPLCNEIFMDHGVTTLAGSIVKDPEQILKIVSQGGGVMSMKPYLKHVLLRK